MLEKCMRREIYLEKRVSELTRVEHKEEGEHVLEELYEASNTSLVLMETCRELLFEMQMLEVYHNWEVHQGAESKDEIQKLKGYLTEAECLVEKYQDKCSELEDECKKVISVEKEVNDVKVKLQHAEACHEAIKDEKNMLRSAFEEMKKNNKFSQFEAKKEIRSVTDRIKSLETTLHRMEEASKASAKDTSLCSKMLTYVVMHQMSLERERQQ
ncbi:uncharacterized protein [Rutidosis leptorrhynchoides]|uniref:uncharacterized protein n=1 Tax=Rutidosis leptorrhynchoides TaxID=125765 RepID=UPI003A9A40D8